MKEIDIYDKEKLVPVAHRLINVLPQFEKFLDVLESLDSFDKDPKQVYRNKNGELKGESSIEVLEDFLCLLRDKGKFERLFTILNILDTGEKLDKLEKLVNK